MPTREQAVQAVVQKHRLLQKEASHLVQLEVQRGTLQTRIALTSSNVEAARNNLEFALSTLKGLI